MLDFRYLGKRYLFADPNILNNLRKDFEIPDQICKRLASSGHDFHYSQSGEKAISRGCFSVTENDVAGLLAAENRSGLEHLLEYVLVSDIGAEHTDSRVTQRDFQTHVRHGCGNNGGTRENATRLHVARNQQQYAVAIHHSAIRVAEQDAIGIPVKGNAQIKMTLLLSDSSTQRLRMQGATLMVDILPVRRHAQVSCLKAASAKKFRSFSRGCAVGAIHQNSDSAQVRLQALRQPFDVRMTKACFTRQAGSRLHRHRQVIFRILQQSENFLLDGKFMRVGQLVSIARENFDAIVSPWIVRRRDHNPGSMVAGTREVGHPRSRNHTGAMDSAAAGNQP